MVGNTIWENYEISEENGIELSNMKKSSGQKSGTILLGKMLGILKPFPLPAKFMFVGICFLVLEK